jgi:hypothetical protein
MKPLTNDEIAQTDREIRQAEIWKAWGGAGWWFCLGALTATIVEPNVVSYGWVKVVFAAVGFICLVKAATAEWSLPRLRKNVHSGPRASHEHICKTCLEKSLAANGGIRFRRECSDYDCKIPEDIDSCSECSHLS